MGKPKKMTATEKAWVRGFVTGLAEMNRALIGGKGADPARVVTCAREACITLQMATDAGCSEHDMMPLQRAGVT